MKRYNKLCLIIIFLIILSAMMVACGQTDEWVKVTFTVDGEIHKESIILHGAGIENVPEVPAKQGYLGEWSVNDYSEFYRDTTITAVYTKNFFTVTFRADNLVVRTTNIIFGENPSSLPPVPLRVGYTGSWSVTDFTEMRIDAVINAIYTPIMKTITFVSQGDEDYETITIILQIPYGSDLTDMPEVPERIGNIGLWGDADFTNVTEDFTVSAIYHVKIVTVQLIGADTSTSATMTFSFNQKLNLPSTQTKEGFIFNGWYFDDDFENPATNTEVIDDTNIYAYWVEINHSLATDINLFEFTLLDSGTYEIAPIEQASLPTNVVLPNSYEGILVTKIQNNAFSDFTNLTTIVLPVGITVIGNSAFSGCSGLTTIIIAPRTRLKEIGNYAFYQNTMLSSISISSTIQIIGDFAFSDCPSLTNLNIPLNSSLRDIGNSAFKDSSAINEINISANIVNIGDFAFSLLSNTNLNFEGLHFLNSVGRFAFQNCSRLYTFDAPNILEIGDGAFKGCSSLMELTITGETPIVDYFGLDSFTGSYEATQIIKQRNAQGEFVVDNNNYVYQHATRRIPISLETIRIRSGADHLADHLLNNIVSVSNIYIPSSVKTIGRYALAAENGDPYNFMKSGTLSIPSTSLLEEIEEKAFFRRTSFSEITLPSRLKTIGNEAFRVASNLTTITLANAENLEYVGKDVFVNTNWLIQKSSGIVYFGGIAIGYKGASTAGNINLVIASNTKAIAPYAFSQIPNIITAQIPQSVKLINAFAFFECNGLTSVNIAEGTEEIKDGAFRNCVSLTTITIPKSIATIGENILKGCNNLTTMNIYGDRLIGEFFSQDSLPGTYAMEQQQKSSIVANVTSDSENNSIFYLKWSQTKDMYDNLPSKYAIVVDGATNDQGEPIPKFILGNITHNNYDNNYYKINGGIYSFTIQFTKVQPTIGRLRYTSQVGQNIFLPDGASLEDVLSVEAIFIETYYAPTSLKKIVLIPDSDAGQRQILPYAFSNMTSLEELILAEGIVSIGQNAFLNCSNLGRKTVANAFEFVPLNLPASLEIIGENAFKSTQKLKQVTYSPGSKLKEIQSGAFSFSGLESFFVPASLLNIGESAFENNSNLSILQFAQSQVNKNLAGDVLNYLKISDFAFRNCNSITNIIFPDRVTAIGDSAFTMNTSLSSVIFNSSSELVEMGDSAFAFCDALTSIVLPQKINLDEVSNLLNGCGGLREITIYNTDTENYHSATLGSLFGTQPYSRSYQAEQNGSFYYIPTSLTTINLLGGRISASFLENARAIMIVNLENITSIGEKAFENCSSIEKIDLPDTVESIGDFAFQNCSEIVLFNILETSVLTDIGRYAFSNASSLESFKFPAAMQKISSYAFYNCISLEIVEMPNITQIDSYAFYGCSEISKLDLSMDIVSIGDYAFYNCINAEIPFKKFDSLESIGNFAFYNCLGIKILRAENILSIGIKAFGGAYNLEEISLPGNTGLGSIFGSAFYEKSYAVNQNGIYYIPNSLTNVRISSTAISLPALAFKDCQSVVDIIFHSAQPPALGSGIFNNTSADLKLFVPSQTKQNYINSYLGNENRIYSHPSSLDNFVFTLNADGTYSISAAVNAVIGEILYLPSSFQGIEITKITANAFRNNVAIREVIIPQTIVEISQAAFENCSSLARIIFEGGSRLAIIGNDAFNKCVSMEKIKIPSSVITIGDYAFAGKRTFVPASNSYSYESALAIVEFEDNSSLETIGRYAFYLTKSLTSITIPSSVSEIKRAAFSESGLINIYFEDNFQINAINEETFMDCNNLQSIQLPEYITYIGRNAFANCSQLSSIGFGSAIAVIDDRAFFRCSSLVSIRFPSGTNIIGNEAFRYCTALESIYVPDTVDIVGDYCFNGCGNLFDVTINPITISYIGEFAFSDTSWYNAQQDQSDDGVIYLNNFAYSYKGAMPIDTTLVLKEGTVGIAPRAFENQSNLVEIVIPDTVVTIGDYAFLNCVSLANLTIEDDSQLINIGKRAFYGTSIESIVLPQSLQRIGDYAFSGILNLTSLEIEENSNLISIGKEAFSDLTNLNANIVLPVGLKTIAYSAFYRCSQMTLTIPENSQLIEIGLEAFSHTKKMIVNFPAGITTINNAFSNASIDYFFIPSWVKFISEYAFIYSDIMEISIATNNQLIGIGDYSFFESSAAINLSGLNKLKTIGNYAFYRSEGLQILVATSISNIGTSAFEGCNNITELTVTGAPINHIFGGNIPSSLSTINIAAGVTAIQQAALENVSSLVTVNFPATLKTIATNAFRNSSSLSNINFEMEESLSYVGKDAFSGTNWMASKPSGVVYLGKIAYYYKPNANGIVAIVAGTTAVAEYCFYGSTITSIFIPTSVNTIDAYAFAECSYLTNIALASGINLKKIGTRAFQNCIGIESFAMPLAVETIGEEIFNGCYSFTSLNFSGGVKLGYLFGETSYPNSYAALQNENEYFLPISLKNIRIIDNSAKIVDFCMQNAVSLEMVVIATSVREIGQRAFENSSSLSQLTIVRGSLLEKIGDFAFGGCSLLTTINLPISVVTIGEGILASCKALTQITMGGIRLAYLFGEDEFDTSYAVVDTDKTYYLPNSLNSIVIADSATEISPKAFAGTRITSITLPAGIQKIGEYAFYNAVLLNNIALPTENSLTTIESYAFYGCEALTSFVITQNITYIGNRVFYNCIALAEINILSQAYEMGYEVFENTAWLNNSDDLVYAGNTLIGFRGVMSSNYILTIFHGTTAIAAGAFENQSNLTTVYLTPTLKTIGEGAFKNCTSLSSINLAVTTLETIADDVFNNCQSLASIVIPPTIKSIGNRAFQNCVNLRDVLIQNNTQIETIGDFAFAFAGLTNFFIPSIVKYIGHYAFAFNYGMLQLQVNSPSLLEEIGEGAFYELRSSTFNLGTLNNVKTVGDYAFYGCERLTSFLAPSVESYGVEVFKDCFAMVSTTLPEGNRVFDLFGFSTNDTTGTKYIVINYGGSNFTIPVSLINITISIKATFIIDYAFYGCQSIKTVLTTSIKSIGEYAFYNCSALERIVGFLDIEYIGDSAFMNCAALFSTKTISSSLQEFVLPSSLRYIGDNAFSNCIAMQKIVLNNNPLLGNIGSYAFSGNENAAFNFAEIKESLTIGEFAFENCKHLVSLVAKNVISIGYGAFSGCEKLETLSVTTYDHLGEIFGETLFIDSYVALTYYIPLSLSTVYVSNAMTSITDYGFAGITSLVTIHLSGVSSIGNFAFKDCIQLEAISIPASVVIIGDFAFMGCNNLVSVIIELPDTLTYIGESAFEDTQWYSDLIENQSDKTIYIGKVAYSHIGSLAGSLELRNDTIGISPKAFIDQIGITEIYLPKTLTAIGKEAFHNCNSVSKIFTTGNFEIGKLFGENSYAMSYSAEQNGVVYYIPLALTEIIIIEGSPQLMDQAFASCHSITSFTLPASVYYIGSKVLYGCNSIATMTLPSNIIAGTLFGNEKYAESYQAAQDGKSYYVPKSLKTINITGSHIADYAYQNLSSLTGVSIPATVFTIGNHSFDGCKSLVSINLHPAISSIGRYAFASCLSLAAINLQSAILLEGVLSGCAGLNSLTTRGNIALHTLFGTMQYPNSYQIRYNNRYYYIPSSLTSITLTNTTAIADNCLQGFAMVNTVNMPTNITKIGKYAFYGLQVLNEITLSPSVVEIGDYAFYNNRRANIIIPTNNIAVVGEYAFANCFALSVFNSPLIVSIGKNAFAGCNALSHLGVTRNKAIGYYFGEEMFVSSYNAIQVKSYYLPVALRQITVYGSGMLAEHMFANMGNLKTLNLMGEVELPLTAFEGCLALDTFNGDNIVYIAEGALLPIPWLSAYLASHANNSLVYIGRVAYTFKGAMNIGANISFRESTTQIYFGAFNSQTRLLRVNISANIRYVDIEAFSGCTSMNYIDVISSNNYFSSVNGVLYNKNGDTLIYRPLGMA